MLQETIAFIEDINEVNQSTGAKSLSKKQIGFLLACICGIVGLARSLGHPLGDFSRYFSFESLYVLKRPSIPWESLWLSALFSP